MMEAFETSSAKGILARDTSLALATITRAVAALDVPSAQSSDEEAPVKFNLRIDVIWASNGNRPIGGPIPAFLTDTASTISKTLNYSNLVHAGTFMQSVSSGKSAGDGTIPRPHKDIYVSAMQNFVWHLRTLKNDFNSDHDRISGLFSARYGIAGAISEAKIDLKPGQKVIIGTTMVGEGIAMIVVLSVSKPEEKPSIIKGK